MKKYLKLKLNNFYRRQFGRNSKLRNGDLMFLNYLGEFEKCRKKCWLDYLVKQNPEKPCGFSINTQENRV